MKKLDKGKAPLRRLSKQKVNTKPQSLLMNVPNHYLAMMKDIQEEAKKIDDTRPLKRRRTGRSESSIITPDSEVISISSGSDEIIEISDGSNDEERETERERERERERESDDNDDDDEDDDVDWDDVNLLNAEEDEAELDESQDVPDNLSESTNRSEVSNNSSNLSTPITISLSSKPKIDKPQKTYSHITKEEKANRLLIHKLQLLCLLHHVSIRNRWCNDILLRSGYHKVLSNNILSELFPPDHLSPTLKTRKFLDGLRHAAKAWNDHFRITHKGLRMIGWNEIFDKSRLVESKMGLEKFRHHLLKFRGSIDLAAQGFCALLRSIDIDVRLVCSLQPLDFTSNISAESTVKAVPLSNGSEYPVYWVEAWDPFGQRWVTIDPVMTNSVQIVRYKSKLEPPQSDSCNSLRYVIAFDVNGKARDVTRRYAFHYNSKTRKRRITCTDTGRLWWERVMLIFSKTECTPRDIAELSELNKREESEELPTSIQDFKGHPVYVLEQHLHQNEILDPKVQCGTLALKHSKKVRNGSVEKFINGRTCPIYRRRDVKIVKSAQVWYRLGRIIKPGSQPLKYSKAKRIDDGEEDEMVGLYSLDQTTQYNPPPVQNGQITKNGYGNIDVYVPSMIPKGAVHLKYPNISLAAKLLGIDYADAVCGFDFKSRRMTPRVEGIVIAKEFKDSVIAVYNQLIEEKEEEDRKLIEAKALLRWKRYLIALQIRHRLEKVHGKVEEDEEGVTPMVIEEMDAENNKDSDKVLKGKEKMRFDLSGINVEMYISREAPDNGMIIERRDEMNEDRESNIKPEGIDGRRNMVVDDRTILPKAEMKNEVTREDVEGDKGGIKGRITGDIKSDIKSDIKIDENEDETQKDDEFLSKNDLSFTTINTLDETQKDDETQLTSFSESLVQDLEKSDSDGGFMAESMSESELLADFDDFDE